MLNADLRRLALLLGAAFILGIPFGVAGWTLFAAALFFIFQQQREFKELERWSPVSYTHLTLPTTPNV